MKIELNNTQIDLITDALRERAEEVRRYLMSGYEGVDYRGDEEGLDRLKTLPNTLVELGNYLLEQSDAPEDPERTLALQVLRLAKQQVPDDVQIDFQEDMEHPEALVSLGEDNGAYVQAWVWVSFDGTELDKTEEGE